MLILHSIRLYLPEDALHDRIGSDVEPLSQYVKLLQRAGMQAWKTVQKGKAKGLLIAIGIRPGGSTRAWADAVDGDLPVETLQQISSAFEQVAAIPIKNGPVAFAMEIGIDGERPKEFPVIPQAWKDAAAASKESLLIPDQMFEVIWPEPAR